MSFTKQLTKLFMPSTYATHKIPTLSNTSSIQEKANPFFRGSDSESQIYGKNIPVPGGYFAGYYNGKQNIVGKNLFVLV